MASRVQGQQGSENKQSFSSPDNRSGSIQTDLDKARQFQAAVSSCCRSDGEQRSSRLKVEHERRFDLRVAAARAAADPAVAGLHGIGSGVLQRPGQRQILLCLLRVQDRRRDPGEM